MNAPARVTSVCAGGGEPPAADALFTALYHELRRLGRRQLARVGGGVSLGPTTLLHEAYLDISARGKAVFLDRAHFMAYAARTMRGIIIDHARARRASKRGGGLPLTSLDDNAVAAADGDPGELARIGCALDQLALVDAPLAEVVELKFFCGFSFAEIAAMREVSERTVQRHWQRARRFLHRQLRESEPRPWSTDGL